MPVFVHITSARNLRSIRRSGIAPPRRRRKSTIVFAAPVTPDFYISHQWLRELKRWNPGRLVAVYFRVPDDEPVHVGHYGQPHLPTTAARAVALMWTRSPTDATPLLRTPNPIRNAHGNWREGFQVILHRRIRPAEILRAKSLPQTIGWRYKPGAHGQPPFVCSCCCRGQRGSRTLLLRRAAAASESDLPFARNNAAFRTIRRRTSQCQALDRLAIAAR